MIHQQLTWQDLWAPHQHHMSASTIVSESNVFAEKLKTSMKKEKDKNNDRKLKTLNVKLRDLDLPEFRPVSIRSNFHGKKKIRSHKYHGVCCGAKCFPEDSDFIAIQENEDYPVRSFEFLEF